MPIPTVTPLPTPPSRGQAPAVFVPAADQFFDALPDLVTEMNAFGAAVIEAAADYLRATSTSSVAIGTGAKSFTIQTGKAFVVGQFVLVANTADPTKYMAGQVTAHNSTTGALTINVPTGYTGGSGTLAAWTIGLTGARGVDGTNGTNGTNGADGATGATGATGPAGGALLTLISSSTPTGVGTVTFSSIPSAYEHVFLAFDGLSHNNGAAQTLRIEVSTDGTTWSTPFTVGGSAGATVNTYGGIHIPSRKKNAGAALVASAGSGTSPSFATGGVATSAAWFCTGGINHIRISYSAGNFDAGTISLFGG
jgi:hypothetical protein